MKLSELKKEIQKFQYFEDTNIIDVALASVIATRLKLGDPIWLIVIGPSSSGKSQILRPVSLTDTKFLHRLDDLTENTFLSAAPGDEQKSLLLRIGALGMMVISDFTVIFSKSSETRATILSQFRMIYDGEMTKFAGNNAKPIQWKGYLGVIAGSTPSIYSNFEEVSDMGERFIYYRMKPYDAVQATRVSMKRKLFGRELDEHLADLYSEYIKEVVVEQMQKKEEQGELEVELSDEINERILRIAMFAEKIRTASKLDWRGNVIKIPVAAMPMRVALQLTAMAKALAIIRRHEGKDLDENDSHILEWCGYSLANEEKRTALRIIATRDYGVEVSTSTVADEMGLNTEIVSTTLQNLAAVGVLKRSAGEGALKWRIDTEEDYKLIRSVEGLEGFACADSRDAVHEEGLEQDRAAEASFMQF